MCETDTWFKCTICLTHESFLRIWLVWLTIRFDSFVLVWFTRFSYFHVISFTHDSFRFMDDFAWFIYFWMIPLFLHLICWTNDSFRIIYTWFTFSCDFFFFFYITLIFLFVLHMIHFYSCIILHDSFFMFDKRFIYMTLIFSFVFQIHFDSCLILRH